MVQTIVQISTQGFFQPKSIWNSEVSLDSRITGKPGLFHESPLKSMSILLGVLTKRKLFSYSLGWGLRALGLIFPSKNCNSFSPSLSQLLLCSCSIYTDQISKAPPSTDRTYQVRYPNVRNLSWGWILPAGSRLSPVSSLIFLKYNIPEAEIKPHILSTCLSVAFYQTPEEQNYCLLWVSPRTPNFRNVILKSGPKTKA